MEFGTEHMCHTYAENWKTKTTEGIEQDNPESIRTLRRKGNYKYQGIFEISSKHE